MECGRPNTGIPLVIEGNEYVIDVFGRKTCAISPPCADLNRVEELFQVFLDHKEIPLTFGLEAEETERGIEVKPNSQPITEKIRMNIEGRYSAKAIADEFGLPLTTTYYYIGEIKEGSIREFPLFVP
ncbi:hypothetical protein BMS3Bbin16_00650 [archaeon BMS3Bbin16]|nr:hypothetical protein BMS3Bbin16_00650 [archaeon BMS3Bbin16]